MGGFANPGTGAQRPLAIVVWKNRSSYSSLALIFSSQVAAVCWIGREIQHDTKTTAAAGDSTTGRFFPDVRKAVHTYDRSGGI